VNPFPALILTGDDFTAEHKSNNQNVLVADSLRAVYIAAQCLFLIGQYEDSINLLNPLLMIDDNESVTDLMTEHYNSFTITNTGISQISALYCLVGKCYFALDNRAKSSSMLLMSLKIDMTCLESLDFIAEHGLLNETAAVEFYNQSFNNNNCSWLKVYYRNFLNIPCERTSIENNCVSASCRDFNDDGPELSRKAGVFFRRNFIENAYQVSKRAYFLDPHNNHCLSIYVASLVQLKQLTELFYLAHELVNSFPKSSMSWYTIGCYYWCCAQMDIARSYFCKSTQIDKRNVNSWVMLGHVLSHQEENEQAISAYRTAIRLLPDNFLPMLFIARELLRANYDRLALQILVATLKFSNSHDLTILNEIGVAYFKLNNFSDALSTLSDAIGRDFVDNFANNFSQSRDCEIEVF
jgi:anaphase-promoting complex subunit 6